MNLGSGSLTFSEEDLDPSSSSSMLTPFSKNPSQKPERSTTNDPYVIKGQLSIPAQFQWDIADYQVGKTLGSGSFGCTMVAYRNDDANKVAPFALKVQRVRTEDELVSYLDRELSMGLFMTYGSRTGRRTTAAEPYLGKVYAVQLVDHLPDKVGQSVSAGCEKLFIKWLDQSGDTLRGSYVLTWMQLTDGVSLSKHITEINDYPALSVDELRTSLFSVLWSLHGASQEFGFTHNDLNPGNMILSRQRTTNYFRVVDSGNGEVLATFRVPKNSLVTTIIDFGKSTTLYNEYHLDGRFAGAPAYVTAPEVATAFLAGRRIMRPSIASDVYSVGRSFMMLLTRQVLFKQPVASFENIFLSYLSQDTSPFGYEDNVNDMFGPLYYADLLHTILYAYEYNLLRGASLATPIMQDGRYAQSMSMFQRAAQAYHMDRYVLKEDRAYGNAIVKALDLAIAQRVPKQERETVRDLFNQMMAWDPAARVGAQDSLDALLAHPFFKPLRVNKAMVQEPLYTVTEEGSLYFPQNEVLRNARMNSADNSGFRIDAKIK